MFRVAREIRVGRETGNTHIFFLGLKTMNDTFKPALFLNIHTVFNFNFLKDNETFKSVIKGKQLHTLSSL